MDIIFLYGRQMQLTVSVVGDFNNWNTESHPLFVRWKNQGYGKDLFPVLHEYGTYKYYIEGYEGVQIIQRRSVCKLLGSAPCYCIKNMRHCNMNGTMMSGCKNEKNIIHLMRHGVFMKCILQAG